MTIGIMTAIIASLKGRNLFHVNCIKKSYRIRGKVARIQMNRVAINIVFMMRPVSDEKVINGRQIPVKKTTDSRLIIRMLAYSAIKIRANMPLLYSTLNPETSSDSPSAKSNGVRFVSARLVMNHIIARGLNINIIQDIELIEIRDISICRDIINALSRIRDILTSYEIV